MAQAGLAATTVERSALAWEPLRLRARDGTPLAGRRWASAAAPLGDVLLVHGLAEHLGRYEGLATALAAASFRVTGVELRGHGDSEGRRGHVRRWSDYGLDLNAAAEIGGPFFVVAHSMGALAVLDWLRQPQPVLGLVLGSPLLGVAAGVPRWKEAAGRLLARLLPALPMSNGIDPTLLSHDEESNRRYAADPKVFRTVTPRWFEEMRAAIGRVQGDPGRFRVPLQLHLGMEDRIVDVRAAERFAAGWGGPLEIQRWPGCYHELFQETVRERVFASVRAWLERRAAAGARPR